MFKPKGTGFISRPASLGFRLLVYYNGLEPIELCQGLLFLLIVLPTLPLNEVSATSQPSSCPSPRLSTRLSSRSLHLRRFCPLNRRRCARNALISMIIVTPPLFSPSQTTEVCEKHLSKRSRCTRNGLPNGGGVQIWVLSC